jgi:hypothetical protein
VTEADGDALIPLYGFVEGDTLGLLVLAYKSDTVAELGDRLQQAARVRVAERDRVRIMYQGRVLEPALTLEMVGIAALDRVDLVREGN